MDSSNPQANAQQPTVSIICRSVGRATLQETIASVQNQTWRPLQLILVDAGGNGLTLPDLSQASGLEVQLVSNAAPLSRPKAANAGLDAARGDYIMFLDDDDWIAPEHVSTLIAALNSSPDQQVAYSDVVVATADGRATEKVFSVGFDATLLKRDNYIPIHAVLFSNTLKRAGCRFDEALDIYEDWDFWLQCAAISDFLHVPVASAFYRQGGDSATALENERDKYRPNTPQYQARVHVLQKWLPRWKGEDLNAIIGSIDVSEHVRNLEAELQRVAAYSSALEAEHKETVAKLDQALKRADEYLNEINTERALQESYKAERDALQIKLSAITSSSLWKITKHLHRIENRIRRTSGNQQQ